ncbi:hypothetical protein H0H81_003041 [Sphagnurus paluster]|uniref:WIBG Mago-binding domain-containing protein n=1 Tax=Sphagnurus paluster TaxID=117069 RepID=A0A9P7FVC4_9AGAR|nr:hypothetical protein H0H81_003041 [Sphagnurus paluster]
MSRPPLNPDKTVAGIAVDPQTLERVIPESKRPDGTVRKQIKIRPGFTPQEDVRRFRGTRQAQMDATALPKGHIIGWAPPPQSTAVSGSAKPLSKSAKKNAKRREKKEEKKKENVPDNWEEDEEDDATVDEKAETTKAEGVTQLAASSDTPVEDLTSKLGKLGVK